MKYIFFIAFNMSTLYGIQDELVEAFNQLEKPIQEEVCNSIKQPKSFVVCNDAHIHLYQRHMLLKGKQEAVQMINAGEGRVKIFKGDRNFEVLIAAFNKLCT